MTQEEEFIKNTARGKKELAKKKEILIPKSKSQEKRFSFTKKKKDVD